MSIVRKLLLLPLLVVAGTAFADNRLPAQPLAAGGGYIVKWDCTAKNGLGDFAASNDMQWDETFVFAINLAGTQLGDWVMKNPEDARRVRSVAFDKMTTSDQHWQDNTARLWHIRDTIFGATFNFKQMPGAPVSTQSTGSRLAIRAQIFGFETVLGDKCGTAPSVGSLWYYSPAFYSVKDGDGYLFQFAAFTGAHSDPAFTSNDADNSRNRWVDNGTRINANGYASPWSDASPCPRFYTTDYELNTTSTTVCPLDAATQSATISTSGSMQNYTYLLYKDDVPVSNGAQAGDGGNLSWTTDQPGTYTVWYYKTDEGNTPVMMVPCSGASEITLTRSATCVEDICPTFTWAIDGKEGLATPMYPGGWYEISVSTETGAPAPALTISGTGVEVKSTTTKGNTTTALIHLAGNATGELNLNAHTDANTSGYKACDDPMTPTIAECDGMTTDTWKIEWSNFDGYPKYQIHGGANVFLRDDNGVLAADIVHTDGMDEWSLIPTGETANSLPVYYIQNALTRRYLCRDSQRGLNGSWEYARALLSATNAQTADFKWVFHTYMEGTKKRTLLVCVDGYTGTDDNIKNGAFVIHNRNWEEHTKNNGMFTNPDVPSPYMVCGKTGDQGLASPAFRMRGMEHPAVSAFSAKATLSWKGTAPGTEVKLMQGNTCQYTAERSDNIHSLNGRVWFETANSTVATVDAKTGLVTANAAEGETDILVILNDTGCFRGDTLRYHLKISKTPVCPDPVYIPYPNLTYNLNADAFPIELAEASGTNVRYQWFYYTDANTTPKPYTGEGATTNACIPATNTEGKTYYYCMVYTDDCPDGVVYCNTADVTVQGCQTFNGTSFTLTSNKTNYNEGEQIVLTATFNGYGGEHHYVWKISGTPIDSSATHQIVEDFQFSTLTIPAAAVTDGGTYTVTIYDGNCEKSATRTITVKEKDPVDPTERVKYVTLCADSTIVLRADSLGHYYEWNTGATEDQISVTPTTPGTETYTLRVYDYKIKSTNNLMANGDFETYTDYHQKPAGFTSDYQYLAFSPTGSNLYEDPIAAGKSGVYLLSCNAKTTWRDYASVTPHGGKYFAMFDAAGSGFAWRVSTNDNPNMKLVKNAKYIFSYWAADLNEANQRQHPAELQFSINYKDPSGQMIKEYLGQKMTLGEDNKWHYSEVYWTAPCNSDYIEIGVEDLCNHSGVGNDFGLDDIIFQMVTGESVVTLDKQKWVLTVEDCTPETCEDVIYRKWNDFLFVDNFSGQYVGYQWYSDGAIIPGANGQYYYAEGVVLRGDGHAYHCVMTKTDGTKETACAHLFDEFGASVQSGRTPAPVRAMVYSPAGHLLYHAASVEDILPQIPSGCYILRTESEGEVHSQKLIIP